MRFTPIVLAGLVAVAKAQDNTAPADAAPTGGLTDEVKECISACDAADTQCIAHCTPVPSPDEANLTALHDCVGECDQGSGSEQDTIAYGNCVSQCVAENYYDPEIGTPGQGQSGSGSSGSDKDGGSGDDKEGGSDGEGSDGEGSDGEGSDGEDGGDEGAAAGLVASPLLALFGVVGAVLAF